MIGNEEYLVTLNPKEIDFLPSNTIVEVLQNVYTILSTTKYSAPLFREFGTSASYLDEPHAVARMRHTKEIIEAVEQYEPRAFVTEVKYYSDEKDGKVYPAVTLRLRGG